MKRASYFKSNPAISLRMKRASYLDIIPLFIN